MPKSKTKKLKEFYDRIKPLLINATPEQKAKLGRIIEAVDAARKAKKTGKKPKETVSETLDYLPEK